MRSTLARPQKEQAALKKLENVKIDHERRLQGLKDIQEANAARAELIELNVAIVDKAIQVLIHARPCDHSSLAF